LQETEVTQRFEATLSRGFTLVYNLRGQRPDFALGLLREGELREHPFSDGRPWFANELARCAHHARSGVRAADGVGR
jgi:hypothetical protein